MPRTRLGLDGLKEHGKSLCRFPPQGLNYPNSMTDIGHVKHKRGKLEKSRKKPIPNDAKRVSNKELQDGLRAMGLVLTKDQVQKLQHACNTSTLQTISSMNQPVPEKKVNRKNSSVNVSTVLDPKSLQSKDDQKEQRLSKCKKNLSTPVKSLIEEEFKEEEQEALRSRRAEFKEQTSLIYSGDQTKTLMANAKQKQKCEIPVKVEPTRHQAGVVRIVKHQLLSRFGRDLSRLRDAFESSDPHGAGQINSESFKGILAKHAGVGLADKDFNVLAKHWKCENNMLNYPWILDTLREEAIETFPDGTVIPVESSKKRSLRLKRQIGNHLVATYGSIDAAYQHFSGQNFRVDDIVKSLGPEIIPQDRKQFTLDLQRAIGPNSDGVVDKTTFATMLTPAETDAVQVKAAPAKSIKSEHLLQRVREFVERKQESRFGPGTRKLFRKIDIERNVHVPTHVVVKRLQGMGLELNSEEAQQLSKVISQPGTGICTYSSLARGIYEEKCAPNQHKRHHHHKQRKTSVAIQRAIDVVKARNKQLHKTYLGFKKGQPLSCAKLKSLMATSANITLGEEEFERLLCDRHIPSNSTDITFEQFQRLMSIDKSFEHELSRKVELQTRQTFFTKPAVSPGVPPTAKQSTVQHLLQTEHTVPPKSTKVLRLKMRPPTPPPSSIL